MLLVGLLLCVTGAARWIPAGEFSTEPSSSQATHREEIDDSPGIIPRDQQLRVPPAQIMRGLHTSIQVNTDSNGNNIVGDAANEPSLAINFTNPDNLVIGWRQFDTISSNFREAGYAYSNDGGVTWTFPGVLEDGIFRSDPVLSSNTLGGILYYSLSSVTSAEMFVSSDGGVSWLGPFPALGGDKPWMTIDTTGGIGNDLVHVIWNAQFTCCAMGTDLTRSLDDGETYEGPWIMPQKPKWGTIDVGPDGALYVVGARLTAQSFPSPHMILRSTNARVGTEAPVFELVMGLDLGGETVVSLGPNPGGLLGQVNVAVDRSGGPTDGNVYVLASVDPQGPDPLDVMFIRSTDGGASWTSPLRINDDAANDAWQWFGTMSVAPNGRIDVIWNDTRNDPTDVDSETYYSYSTDAGTTWSANLPVTPAWDSGVGYPNQNKIGDYYHMISDAEGAGLAYAATFNGGQDVYFLRVGDCNANGQHDATDIAMQVGTDCDGNGVLDSCQDFIPCLAPVPDLSAERNAVDPSLIDITYDVETCNSEDHALIFGALGDFSTVTAAACSIGSTGSFTATPPAGDVWFLIAGTEGGFYSSVGQSTAGERVITGLAAFCPSLVDQDISKTCP